MEQSLLSKIAVKIGVAILVISLIDLVYLNFLVIRGEKPQARTIDLAPKPTPSTNPTASTPSATPLSQNTVNTTTQQTIVQTAQKEIFIPVGGGSTNSHDYTNIPGAQVSIDSANYSGIASADFEANIWVTGGNGKATVQLYDATLGRPVWNSELSTTSGTGMLLVSSPINLDSGKNTYQIQAKTDITEFAANVSTGRIKIVLK